MSRPVDALLDASTEMAESLLRHPLRTLLTMGSVGWGTFVLVLLLGVGEGLQSNVRWQFRDDATNSLWLYRGETSRPFEGMQPGRTIPLGNPDLAAVVSHLDRAEPGTLEHITGRFYGPRSPVIGYRSRAASFSLRAVHPDHQYLERTLVTKGRFLDDLDVQARRKVVVVGSKVADFLFRGTDPLGETIAVAGVPFLVIGVFEDEGEEGELEQVYVPVTAAQAVWGGREDLQQIMFTIRDPSEESAERIERSVRSMLAERHRFDPEDTQAVRVRNNIERYLRTARIFELLQTFVTFVGAGTVGAGLVSVSNITIVSVRERTAEIALHKALGATPAEIVRRIILESTLLTAVSGYLGIVLGVAALLLLRALLPDNEYLRNPEVKLLPALLAALLLSLAGAVAGLLPAVLAARVPPAEGLR